MIIFGDSCIFTAMHNAGYNNGQSKTFIVKGENVMGLELFFSTGYNGRGDTVSITAFPNGTFDLEVTWQQRQTAKLNNYELETISEEQLLEEIKSIGILQKTV